MRTLKWLALLLAAVVGLGPAGGPALAQGPEGIVPDWDWSEICPLSELSLSALRDGWDDMDVEEGSTWTVRSAPFEDAWSDGGTVTAGEEDPIVILGTANAGAWTMIEYGLSGGDGRIGWIPARDSYWDARTALPENAYSARLSRDAVLTDDPLGSRAAVLCLRAGEEVKALGTLREDWVYVQAVHEGRIAWLFAERDAVELLPVWELSPDKKTLTVLEGVTRIGLPFREDDGEDPDLIRIDVERDDRSSPALDREVIPESVEEIILPHTLRYLGPEAVSGVFSRIYLPGLDNSGIAPSFFHTVSVDTLVLGAGCAANPDRFGGSFPSVAFEVESGNRLFSARDGVLFSLDGKKLLVYPEFRPADHYDVPAGTEEIADCAFASADMNIRLKTISLPDGLKRIGSAAFSGCGRLISLTVPLTVTDLAENAFAECVSLERLSLPPGLTAYYYEYGTDRGDFSHYRGDNWETKTKDTDSLPVFSNRNYTSCNYYAYTDTESGLGAVPFYDAPDAEFPSGEAPAGTLVHVTGLRNGRALEMTYGQYRRQEPHWFRQEDLLALSGSVFFVPDDHYSDVYADWTRPAGDPRLLGFLVAKEGPIRFYDAPDGNETGHAYSREQAEVLASRDGWLQIRTVYGISWIQEAYFLEIPPEEP